MSVKKFTDDNASTFTSLLGKDFTIVKAGAKWCGPCKEIAPVFHNLAHKHRHITFIEVDVDDCPEWAENFGVESIPDFFLFRGGKVVKRFDADGLDDVMHTLAK